MPTTVHSAKGLEFDAVSIIRAAEKVLLGRAQTPEDVEVELRLLYLAMTRARDAVTITSARTDGHSRWVKSTYATSLLSVNGSPREDRFEDYAWMLRR